MTDEIYILKNDGQLEAMREQKFDLEDVLQQLVADHPELLSGQQIDPDNPRRWILVNREQGISDIIGGGNRWALDHLLIDQDAIPTLVEVKRSENSEISPSSQTSAAPSSARCWTMPPTPAIPGAPATFAEYLKNARPPPGKTRTMF